MKRRRLLTSALPAALTVLFLGCGDGAPEGSGDAPSVSGMEEPAARDAAPSSPAESGLVDPNEAERERLLSLPHVGEAVADAVISGRPYENMLEVDAVLAEHLSADQREEVYGSLFKPLDLNSASGREILLIPGVGERMEHEFEEYRPYRAMEEFRREIGKYVDEDEVARLERYVTLP